MAIKKELIIKKIKPTFTKIVTTADQYTEIDVTNESGFVAEAKLIGTIKPVQNVIAVGEVSRGIVEGQKVYLDFDRYKVFKTSRVAKGLDEKDEHYRDELKYEIPTVEISGTSYLLLDSADVVFIIEDSEYKEITVPDNAVVPKPVSELGKKAKESPLLYSASANVDLSKLV